MLDLGTLRVGIKADSADAKRNLKEFQGELQNTETSANKAGEEISASNSKVLDAFSAVAGKAKIALGAVATAFAALVTESVKGYADYEQNIGGINKLFGDSADQLQQYAKEAWQTIGVSANTYMEQVTSFSASLISSLGGDTASAVEYANTAMVDMSDNANTFGTSIEDIQHAYQGFAKQNYTMLDNLKLGYGGTKEEMERLIDDANRVKEANGEMGDLSIDSFADVTEAIHLMQEQMGISGTTANEASTTITGSINSMKAAWDNLLVSFGDDSGSMDGAIQSFADSLVTVIQNIVPRVAEVITSIVGSIPELFSSIVAQLPQPIQDFVNVLTTSLQPVIEALIPMISNILDFLVQIGTALQPLVELIMTGLATLGEALLSTFGPIVAQIITQMTEFGSAVAPLVVSIIQNIVTLVLELCNVLGPVLEPIIQGILTVWNAVFPVIQQVTETVFSVIETVITTVLTVISNIIELATNLISGNWEGAWQNIQNIASTVWEAIKSIVQGAIDGVKSIISNILDSIKSTWENAWDAIGSFLNDAWDNIKNGVSNGIDAVLDFFKNLPQNILNALGDLGQLLLDAGKSIMSGLLDGIKNGVESVFDFVSSIGETIAELKGPIPYDLKLLIPNGNAIMKSLATGLTKGFPQVEKVLKGITADIADTDFGTVRVERGFESFLGNSKYEAEKAIPQTTNNNSSITVNNYSPKALDEAESARQFRRATRQYAFSIA